MHDGIDSAKTFVEKMSEIENELSLVIKEAQYENSKSFLTPKQESIHYSKIQCEFCDCFFDCNNKKVRHHNHNTGEYIGGLCNNCNMKIKVTDKIPVFFHNLNYDESVLFTQLVYFHDKKS